MDLYLILYALTGAACILPIARHMRNNALARRARDKHSSVDSFGEYALYGWAQSLVWPAALLVWGVAHLLKREELAKAAAEQARKDHEMSVAEAHKIIETQRQEARAKERALMAEWERKAGGITTGYKERKYPGGWYPSRGTRKDYDK